MKNKEAIEILSKDLGKYILMEHDEAILTAIDALEERPQGDLISRSALLADFKERNIWGKDILEAIDNAPAIAINCKECDGYEAGYSAGLNDAKRPQGECKTCRHRDPEDKKCDCGAKERQGCLFRVSDDYYCKFYEKGGAE